MEVVAPFIHLCCVGAALWVDLVRLLGASLQSQAALAAENLFLRKQLALYRERQVKPRSASDPIRLALVLLARCFAWRQVYRSRFPEHSISCCRSSRSVDFWICSRHRRGPGIARRTLMPSPVAPAAPPPPRVVGSCLR